MTQGLLAAVGHGQRVLGAVLRGMRSGLHEQVAQSWTRCLNEYRLDPDGEPHPPVLDRNALALRCRRLGDVIEAARLEMSTLYQQLADTETAVVLTDGEGVILHLVSSPEFAQELEPVGFTVGALWNEAYAGTNGMGTCLALAEPVSVRQEDHFFTRLTSLTCSAVPVHDPEGRMVAVLDVTSRSALQQQHVLVLLGMTARMIENRLIDQRYRDSHPLHFHTRPELVHTLHEGRLAVDGEGVIRAANRSALFQLGVDHPQALCGRRLEEVFQTTLDDLLERNRATSFHPVAVYRANGAHRFFAVVRCPAAEAQPQSQTGARGLSSTLVPAARPARAVPAAGLADPQLVQQLHTGARVLARGTPLLLRGETGAGKEVFARALHERSPHASGSFVAVNCASLPESLVESELFGYRAGAFTGAQRNGRRGKILQADGGTLFLDEIGDMPLELQARLLRVLDERRVTPLGTEETHPVDFQLISASHRNLLELVAQGRFREDLYYRLAGIELGIPALRERSDKRELIQRILQEENGGPVVLRPEAEQLLMGYRWPGNVRQLRHVLRAAVALADGAPVGLEHLPSLRQGPAAVPAPAVADAPAPALASVSLLASGMVPAETPAPQGLNLIQSHERQVLLQLLEQHRWNVSNVAKALDVSRNTLYRKLHKLQIAVSQRA
ncbi:sigma-54-dependent Fis family transcriptional regulator [uncultured Azohydromonas sp.]|jgi:Transcriptional activator of acetoin/glycerol metabolism|uniref:sigma-54-dependent Fis family transcriptional regulator n=1 Tax=uncultured Azohydromonas sp. TaxID=487342 RepID=UPI00260E8392|nr:sigma-54-dependent Fis family transcriptional regulator [uncultured Azohydromonas sp.]